MGLRGLRPPVSNRLMFVVYIVGMFGIAVVAPSYQGAAPSLNLQLASPDPGPASRAVPADLVFDPTPEAPSPDLLPEAPSPDPTPEAPSPDLLPEVPSPVPTPISGPAPVLNQYLAAPPALGPAPGSLAPGLRPFGSRYEYRDSNKRQIVTVSVRTFAVAGSYSYHFDDPMLPDIITVTARPGWKFAFIGVTWDLAGLVGEGSRTTFVTPSIASYKLIHRGVTYRAIEPGTITDILQDAIIGVGTLAREESIDKDNPGDGILIFEIPGTVTAGESYIELCPQNSRMSEPHSPPWDCTKNAIRWSLVK